jgi:exodeoxyribonuclease V alpha subunit
MATQQYLLHQRNLVYTGIRRGRKLVVVVGQRKALAMAVRNNRMEQRFSGLLVQLKGAAQNTPCATVHTKVDRPCN